jgi:hypothetical protein
MKMPGAKQIDLVSDAVEKFLKRDLMEDIYEMDEKLNVSSAFIKAIPI